MAMAYGSYCRGGSARMEAYNNSHQWATETYMIPVSGANLNLVPPPQEINTMGGVVPEYVVNHGLYYPAPANYYGYYCTGFESPTEWDDHHRLAGLDGQELQSLGLTTDGLQYVYYIPGYGYAQAPLNPYNPYIPAAAAAIGSDNSFLDTQQYIANSPYCQPVSSPYLPLLVQPGIDVIPTVSQDLLLPNAWGLDNSTPESSVVRNMFPPTSSTTSVIPREPSQAATFQSFPATKSTQGQQAQTASVKHTISQGACVPSSVPQDKSAYASLQASDTFRQGNGSSLSAPLKVDVAPYYSLGGLVPNMHGWATGDNTNPRFQFSGAMSNESGNPDKLGEQNRGPRTSKARSQSTSPIVVKAYTNKAGAVDEHGNIKIYTDQYNRTDLPVTYPNAKFFVIKSYSEDDVHKSIKYNVWSSTPSGNKRLDLAYEDARRISGGNSTLCPIFLFFSVNASGQFCGVAEMVGPVDFHNDMDFWQQDKWSGSFPVKWHIVKDVPNTSFRHIVLENNENKPVTNSRDTQEILYIPGLNMLSIFKYSPLRTSVLDDFAYYEERQRIMHEEKTRLNGRLHENPILPPPSAPSSKVSVTIKMPPKRPESSAQSYDARRSMGRVTTDVEHLASEAVNSNRSAKMTSTPGKVNITIKAPPKRDERSAAVKENSQTICLDAADASMSNCNVSVKADPVQDVKAASVLKKVQSLTIKGDASTAVELCHNNQSDILAASNSKVDVFTVGSMPIKVNGFGESSQTLTIGSIPIDSKEPKKNNPP